VIIYAQEVIGSDLLSGIGFGLCFGPPLLLGWYAGVLCDRLAPGRLIQAAQAVFMLAALLLWLADARGAAGARVPLLELAAALAGVGWSFVAPARMATLGQIARPEELKPASVIFNLLVMMGFGLGPLMIALARRHFGWPGVFAGAFALLAIASLTLLRVPTRRSGRVHRPVAAEIREGLAAVRAQPLLLQLMVAAMAGYLACRDRIRRSAASGSRGPLRAARRTGVPASTQCRSLLRPCAWSWPAVPGAACPRCR
ncbi:MAG: MFS transporter, partial [Burkholderiales bacterium]|nr:MFS transporter [Burkholderiales bacterium]